MVYLGRPSTGCATCRKRRVKCDEGKPGCARCQARGLDCPGYRSSFDVAWRPQNAAAEKSVRRQKNIIDKVNRKRLDLDLISHSSSSPIPHLSEDFEAYALNFFLPSYIVLPNDLGIGRGFLQSVFSVWSSSSYDSPLRPAVIAVASCMLEAWSLIKPDQPDSLSRDQYLTAVTALQKSMNAKQIITDDVVMATLMLDFYEGIASFCNARPNKSLHISGTKALLDERGASPTESLVSQNFLMTARTHLVERALRDKDFVSYNISTLGTLTCDLPITMERLLDDLNIEVANLQASSRFFIEDSEDEGTSRLLILQEALELDKRLLAWKDNLPLEWRTIRVSGPDCIPEKVVKAGIYQDYCHLYGSVLIANKLNIFNASRIRLQIIILTCLREMQDSNTENSAAFAKQAIRDLVDNTLASIPFHLGDRMDVARFDDKNVQYPHLKGQPLPSRHYTEAAAFSGFNLTSRLAELMDPEIPIPPQQRGWIGSQLGRLRRIYAI